MSALSQALTQLRNGGMVILVDDEDRENEGDLVIAAEFATPEAINFMARFGRGLICLVLTGEQVDRLGLPPMVANNRPDVPPPLPFPSRPSKGSPPAYRRMIGPGQFALRPTPM